MLGNPSVEIPCALTFTGHSDTDDFLKDFRVNKAHFHVVLLSQQSHFLEHDVHNDFVAQWSKNADIIDPIQNRLGKDFRVERLRGLSPP